ncbi:MAG TPA: SCO family protein [Rudaea sp.]|nr:SCO family protein [Rudaea sp.]
MKLVATLMLCLAAFAVGATATAGNAATALPGRLSQPSMASGGPSRPFVASGALGLLPGDSVYQLDIPLTNQDAHASKLADLRGTPVLIAMFYTSCKYVCPLIVDSMLRIDKGLTADERSHLRVVLVSFDPAHDTPQALKTVADERHLDLPRWTLDRTDAESVRKLAAVLGVQYRAIENGDFNHSTVISLLDKDGRIAARSSRTGEADPDLLAATQRELGRN